MPDDSVLIGLLKWIALALALGSTLWGLLASKPNREEVEGRKRITTSGAVTLAMILAGASVSALSFRLESALKQKNDAEQKRDEAVRQRFDMASGALTMINAVNSRTALTKMDRERADRRADTVDARIAALDRETRERLRDLELAQKVATGTRDNLARTGEALTQIERVLVPLETFTVTVIWKVPGDTAGLKEATAFIARDAKAAEVEEYKKWLSEPAHFRSVEFRPTSYFDVQLGDPYGGGSRSKAERNLSHVISTTIVGIDFYATNALKDRRSRKNVVDPSELSLRGDLHMTLRLPKPETFSYERSSGSLLLNFQKVIAPEDMRRGDAITSFIDLEKAFGTIRLSQPLLARARPIVLEFQGKTRSYRFPRMDELRRVEERGGARFALPPLKPSTPDAVVARG